MRAEERYKGLQGESRATAVAYEMVSVAFRGALYVKREDRQEQSSDKEQAFDTRIDTTSSLVSCEPFRGFLARSSVLHRDYCFIFR